MERVMPCKEYPQTGIIRAMTLTTGRLFHLLPAIIHRFPEKSLKETNTI
jgi:hypothetical protein